MTLVNPGQEAHLRHRSERLRGRPAGPGPPGRRPPGPVPGPRARANSRIGPGAAHADVSVVAGDMSDVAQLTGQCRAARPPTTSSIRWRWPARSTPSRTCCWRPTSPGRRRDAGVGRIIYLGGLGEMGEGLSQHLRSRREVEQRLASTGVPVTTLRAAMIIGAGSASFEILRYLVERLPVMVTPLWVKTESQPVAIATCCIGSSAAWRCRRRCGKTLDIGGPDVVTVPRPDADHGRGVAPAEAVDLPRAVPDAAAQFAVDQPGHAGVLPHRPAARARGCATAWS